MRPVVNIALVFLISSITISDTPAQRPEGGSVEFALLGGLNMLTYESFFGDDETEAYLTLPSGSSGFPFMSMMRMSIWTNSPLAFDFGFGLMKASNGGDLTALNVEGGIGGIFGRNTDTLPFAGFIAGILSFSNGDSDSEGYFGIQGGIRHFFRKHAALRMQIAYRSFSGDELTLKSSLEIVGGLSFLI